jgi:hypothetical protein
MSRFRVAFRPAFFRERVKSDFDCEGRLLNCTEDLGDGRFELCGTFRFFDLVCTEGRALLDLRVTEDSLDHPYTCTAKGNLAS